MKSKDKDIQILFKLLKFLRRYRLRMLVAFLTLFVSTGLSLAIPRIVGKAIDNGLTRAELGYLIQASIAIAVLGVLRGVFTYFYSYLSEYISAWAAYDIRNGLYDHMQRLSFDYHNRMETGDLMSRATDDIDHVRWFISFGVLRALRTVLLFSAIAFLLFSLNVKLTILSLACLPVIAFWAVKVSARMRKLWLEVQERTAAMGTVLHENLSGIRVVKAFNREAHETDKFASEAKKIYEGSIEANQIYAFNSPAMAFLLLVGTSVILWFGGREVISGRLTAGDLTQFVLYLLMAAQPVRMLGYLGNVTSRAISSGERIFEVLETPSTILEKPSPVELGRISGHIRFENVSFAYDSVAPVLKDISFEAKPGQIVALVGATGCGKTTVVSLIPRFYDVTGGCITIDGVDIRDLKLSELRRNTGIVQQDVFLFSATIHDNIAYGVPGAARSEVINAAKAAKLHDFVLSLPQGYDTWVGERGITLSGGQRQRVAIARTILTNPPVLVLDDATSSVDTETEYLIQQALNTVMEGRTTLVIAQRLSTVRRADLILVLHDGEIVERGRHDELLAKDGFYQSIYELQLKGQEDVERFIRCEGVVS